VWIGFRPDAVTPGLSEREIAGDDLRRPQAQPHQLGGIIEIKDTQIVRQLVGSERSLRAGHLRKVQHRWFPAREVAESLAACGFGQTRQVPNVIVRVVDTAAALGTMLIQRMPWLAGSNGGQIREDAVGQHSGGTDPGFGVEGFQHRRRTRQLQHIDGAGTAEVAVGAFEPRRCGGFAPDQACSGEHMLEVDEQWRGGRTGPFVTFDPSRRLRAIHADQFSEPRAAEGVGQIADAGSG